MGPESESSDTEAESVDTALNIKGGLRFRDNPTTQKAHVILRRVARDEDESSDKEGGDDVVYFKLFAFKSINLKSGKELLLTVETEDDHFRDRVVYLEANLDYGEEEDSDAEDATQVEEEQEQEDTTELTQEAEEHIPPKMRRHWYKRVEEVSPPTTLFSTVGVQTDHNYVSAATQVDSPAANVVSIGLQTLPEQSFISQNSVLVQTDDLDLDAVVVQPKQNAENVVSRLTLLEPLMIEKSPSTSEPMELSPVTSEPEIFAEIDFAQTPYSPLPAGKMGSGDLNTPMTSCHRPTKPLFNPFVSGGFITNFSGASEDGQCSEAAEDPSPVASVHALSARDPTDANSGSVPIPSSSSGTAASEAADALSSYPVPNNNEPQIARSSMHPDRRSLIDAMHPDRRSLIDLPAKAPKRRRHTHRGRPKARDRGGEGKDTGSESDSFWSRTKSSDPVTKRLEPRTEPYWRPAEADPAESSSSPATSSTDLRAWSQVRSGSVDDPHSIQPWRVVSVGPTDGRAKEAVQPKPLITVGHGRPLVLEPAVSRPKHSVPLEQPSSSRIPSADFEDALEYGPPPPPGCYDVRKACLKDPQDDDQRPAALIGSYRAFPIDLTSPVLFFGARHESSDHVDRSESSARASKSPFTRVLEGADVPTTESHLPPNEPAAVVCLNHRNPGPSLHRGSKRIRSPSPPPLVHAAKHDHPWPATSFQVLTTLHGRGIRRIVLSPDDSILAMLCDDRTVDIWNAGRLEQVHVTSDSPISAIAWADGILTLREDGVLGKWMRKPSHDGWVWLDLLAAGEQALEDSCLACTPNKIAVSFPRSGVKVWMLVQGGWRQQRSIVRYNVTALAFTEDGDALLGGTKDGVVWHTQVPNGTMRACAFLDTKITSIALNCTAKQAVATQSAQHSPRLINFDPSTKNRGTKALQAKDLVKTPFAVYASRGRLIVCGKRENCLLAWDSDGQVVHGFELPDEVAVVIQTVASSDSCVVAGTDDGRVLWWPGSPLPADSVAQYKRSRAT